MFLADLVNNFSFDLLKGVLHLFAPLTDGGIFDAYSQIICPPTGPCGTPASCPAATLFPSTPPPPPLNYSCEDQCGGSAFYREAAAFGTLGYWAQASWLIQIFDFGLQKIALIGYVVSAIVTLYGFALGNVRPQKFLWFLIGPPICWFLIAELTPVKGVEWRVGNQYRDMRKVWELVEPGLANEDYAIRNGIVVKANDAPFHGGDALNDLCYFPTDQAYACVSDFFAYYDSLISDAVQQLVSMVGVGRATHSEGVVDPAETNISWGHEGGSGSADPNEANNRFKWDLISSIRWDFFSGISDARVKDANLRRAFATFLASDCGVEFMAGIDKAKMTAAAKKGTPFSMVPVLETSPIGYNYTPKASNAVDCWDVANQATEPIGKIHYTIWDELISVIPTPDDVNALMETGNSLGKESNITWMSRNTHLELFGVTGPLADTLLGGFPIKKIITCRAYLIMLMQGLRWEAAHTAYQLSTSGPADVAPEDYLTMMFYGWDIDDPFTGDQISSVKIQQFLEALVLGHLFRNELELAPGQFIEKRYLTTGEQTIQNVKDFQRLNNARSKYGELYAWALMVPYFQGKLLYFLAVAYPFAAMFVVVPGMGKVFVQWMQFWLWVKLWDLGFGLVMVIERSVWAMTANTARNGELTTVATQVMFGNETSVCTTLNHPLWTAGPDAPPDFVPEIAVQIYHGVKGVEGDHESMLCLLDRLLAMSNNTDLDLTNSYYIYIMSALYFAVPAVTGQIVLGAKAGAASMVTGAMSSIAQPAGGAASNANTSEWGRRAKENQAIASQQAFANTLAKGGSGGLAGQVLGAQAEGLISQMQGNNLSARSQGLQGLASAQQGAMSPLYTLNGVGGAALSTAQAAARFPLNSGMRKGDVGSHMQQGYGNLAPRPGGTVDPSRQAEATGGSTGGLSFGSSELFGGDGKTGTQRGGSMTPTQRAMQKRYEGTGDLLGIAGQMAGLGLADAMAGTVSDISRDSTAANAAATDFSMQASGKQMQGQVAGMSASRNEAAALFKAEGAAWGARSDYADKMTDKMAAVTGSAEALNPGQKPTNLMGMAMTGALDRGNLKDSKSKGSWGDMSVDALSTEANAASSSFSGVGANGKEFANKAGSARNDVEALSNDVLYAKNKDGSTMTNGKGEKMTVGAGNIAAQDAIMRNFNVNSLLKAGVTAIPSTLKEVATGRLNTQSQIGPGATADGQSGSANIGRNNFNQDNTAFEVPISTRTK